MTKKRYLLIDAYNVIHAIEELRRALDENQESARGQLIERAVAIHDAEGVHTVLIFDSSSESLEFEHPFGKKTFECVYAPVRLSADGVIEQLLTRVTADTSVTVVSNDGMVRESARVNRAIAMSADDLFDWIDACERRLAQDAERRRKLNEQEWKNRIEFDL